MLLNPVRLYTQTATFTCTAARSHFHILHLLIWVIGLRYLHSGHRVHKMPPKANNNRPTRRNTRSSTHAGDLTPAGSSARHASVVRRAAEEAESRNRGEKAIDAIMNVRQTNPIGLSAAHASAVYGKNTYSANPGRSSDSKVIKAVDESDDDEAFEAQIFGTKKKKKTAMGRSSSSSLRKAMSDAAADMATHKTKEDVDRTDLSPVDTAGADFDPNPADAAEYDDYYNDDGENHGRRTNGQEPVRGPLGLVRPPLDPSRPPHLSGNRNNYTGQTADRNFSSTTFLDSGSTTYNGLRPPSEPPSSLRSKYGIPTGRASSEPYSPGRPDTSRSFIQESDLYGDASVHTPVPSSGARKPFQPSPLGVSSETAGNAEPPSASSLNKLQKQSSSQAGQLKPPAPQPKPNSAWNNKKRPEGLTSLDQEKTRQPIVGPHTPHIPHLGDKQSPPPSLGLTVGAKDDDHSKENEDPYADPEDVAELRNRMRYKKHPQVLGPNGVSVLMTENIAPEEQKEVSELRRRMQNPNLASGSLGKASRPPPPNPLPTSQKSISSKASQPTVNHDPEKANLISQEVPVSTGVQKPVSTGFQKPVKPVQEGKKPVRTPSKSTGANSVRVSHTGTTSNQTPVSPSRSWWQLPQFLWPIPFDIVKDFLKLFLMFGGTVFALMFCIQLASKAMSAASDIHLQDYTTHSGISWNVWPGVKDSFTGLIPTIRNPLGDVDARRLVERLNKFESKLGQLGTMVAEFPSKCYLKVDTKGKTHVPEDFWHAVKDRIQAETGAVVNLPETTEELPPHFWSSFKRMLDGQKSASPGVPSVTGAPCNIDDVDAHVEKKLLSGWESWLRQNSETVSKILGPDMARELPAKTEKELKAHLEQLVKSGGGNLVVSKEQFAKQVQRELETHKKEYQQELREIHERNAKIEEALANAQKNPPQGMSRQEIKDLVDQWARKAVADAKFEAMAQTGIKTRLDDHLANQVNFLAIGSGAVIDPTYTSPMWKIPAKPLKSKAWMQRDGYKPKPALNALQHWDDEGECFCTGNDRNTLSILLSRDITPQHLLVEHILPGATLDPDAMPREIEVWAYFEELNLRSSISSWSAAQFPDTPEEKTLNPGFVKVGQFIYRQQNTGDKRGMQLFKLSSELAGLDAVTHHVVVRAVSNYGADHTCFYRLRLFGDVRQEDMDNEKSRA